MNTLILDAALGTQLAVNGEELPDWKKSLWSAHALIYIKFYETNFFINLLN